MMLLLALGASATAQTLEKTYNTVVTYAKVDANEYVYYTDGSLSGYFYIYSAQHTLLKTIPLPASAGAGQVLHVSKKLFNSDDKYEVVYTNSVRVLVINDEGTVLLDRDSFSTAVLYETTTGAKMAIRRFLPERYTEIYALQGELPVTVPQPGGAPDVAAYPNPASTSITLTYQLPQGQNTGTLGVYDSQGKQVATVPVGQHFTSVLFDVSTLPKGVYFYGLAGGATTRFVVQ